MNRINKVMLHPVFLECLSLNRDREKGRRFCRHDMSHLINVARICYILVMEKQVGKMILPAGGQTQLREIIYAAGLLHDMGRWRQYDFEEDHALAGARLAGGILVGCDFSGEETGVIIEAISHHRSGTTGGGPLGECLRRADDLSRPCWNCHASRECKKISRMETVSGPVY